MQFCIRSTLLLGLAITAFFPSQQAVADVNEYQVKAGFLFNFLKFTIFSPATIQRHKASGIEICIDHIGKDAHFFHDLHGKVVSNRQVFVKKGFSPSCDIGFLSEAADSSEQNHFFEQTQRDNFLGVVETPSAFQRGGIIRFINDKKKIRFEVDLERMKSSTIRLRSQLLRLAKIRGHT